MIAQYKTPKTDPFYVVEQEFLNFPGVNRSFSYSEIANRLGAFAESKRVDAELDGMALKENGAEEEVYVPPVKIKRQRKREGEGNISKLVKIAIAFASAQAPASARAVA